MAILSDIVCEVCKQTKSVCHSVSDFPTVCGECRQKQKDDELAKYLAERAALPLGERLALIEAELYHLSRRPEPFDYNTPIG